MTARINSGAGRVVGPQAPDIDYADCFVTLPYNGYKKTFQRPSQNRAAD